MCASNKGTNASLQNQHNLRLKYVDICLMADCFGSIRGEEFSVLGVKDKMAVWQQKTANSSLSAGSVSDPHSLESKSASLEFDIAKSKTVQPPESPRVMGPPSRNPTFYLHDVPAFEQVAEWMIPKLIIFYILISMLLQVQMLCI